MCLNEGKKAAVIFEHLHKVIGEADFVCGHNIGFDMKIVNAEFHRLSLAPFVEDKKKMLLCTMMSARSYGKKGKWPKLGELHMALFGKPFEDAHRAGPDIAATEHCFDEMVKRGDIKIPEETK
jgi:DNA polymerase-3 subunit alpha